MVTVPLSLGKITAICCTLLLTAYFNIYELPVFYRQRNLVVVTVMVCYLYVSKLYRSRIPLVYQICTNQKHPHLLLHSPQGNLKVTEVLPYGLSPGNSPKALAQERSLVLSVCVCAGPQPAGRKQIKEARLSVRCNFISWHEWSHCGNNEII